MWTVEFFGSKGWEIAIQTENRLDAFDEFDSLMAEVKDGEFEKIRIEFFSEN